MKIGSFLEGGKKKTHPDRQVRLSYYFIMNINLMKASKPKSAHPLSSIIFIGSSNELQI